MVNFKRVVCATFRFIATPIAAINQRSEDYLYETEEESYSNYVSKLDKKLEKITWKIVTAVNNAKPALTKKLAKKLIDIIYDSRLEDEDKKILVDRFKLNLKSVSIVEIDKGICESIDKTIDEIFGILMNDIDVNRSNSSSYDVALRNDADLLEATEERKENNREV